MLPFTHGRHSVRGRVLVYGFVGQQFSTNALVLTLLAFLFARWKLFFHGCGLSQFFLFVILHPHTTPFSQFHRFSLSLIPQDQTQSHKVKSQPSLKLLERTVWAISDDHESKLRLPETSAALKLEPSLVLIRSPNPSHSCFSSLQRS